jgi:hypothetical protein
MWLVVPVLMPTEYGCYCCCDSAAGSVCQASTVDAYRNSSLGGVAVWMWRLGASRRKSVELDGWLWVGGSDVAGGLEAQHMLLALILRGFLVYFCSTRESFPHLLATRQAVQLCWGRIAWWQLFRCGVGSATDECPLD